MKTALSIDWNQIDDFAPGEWPKGVLAHMSARVVYALAEARSQLPPGYAITPSPVARGHVRHEQGGGQHNTNNRARLSTATDVYMRWAHVWLAWEVLQRIPEIGGLGIYTDMLWAGSQGRRAMLHIDTRADRLVWAAWREGPRSTMHYIYLHDDPIGYHRVLAERAKER